MAAARLVIARLFGASPQNPGGALKPNGHVGRFEVLQLGLDDMNARLGFFVLTRVHTGRARS